MDYRYIHPVILTFCVVFTRLLIIVSIIRGVGKNRCHFLAWLNHRVSFPVEGNAVPNPIRKDFRFAGSVRTIMVNYELNRRSYCLNAVLRALPCIYCYMLYIFQVIRYCKQGIVVMRGTTSSITGNRCENFSITCATTFCLFLFFKRQQPD